MASGYLVQETLEETPPGAGTVRLSMDFGNLPEVLAGDLVASCAITTLPLSTAHFVVALLVVPGSTLIDPTGTVASALFTGGDVGAYLITWTPTLVSGQTLPPRVGALDLKGYVL